MRCKRVERQITDFVDGLLAGRRSDRIRRHLAACEACRETEESTRVAVEALGSWPDVPPPEDGLHRLETRIAFAPPPPVVVRGGGIRPLLLAFGAGMATAAAILLLALSLRAGTGSGPAGPADPGWEAAPVLDGAGPELLPGERELHFVDENGRLRMFDREQLRMLWRLMERDDQERLFPRRDAALRVSYEER